MALKLLCYQCGGKFGLVRQRHHGKSFCKMVCLDAYKLGIPPKRDEPIHKSDKAYNAIS